MSDFVFNIETLYGYYITTDPEESTFAWRENVKKTCRRKDYVKSKI